MTTLQQHLVDYDKESSCNYCGEDSLRDFCSRSCYVAYLKD